MSLLQAGVDTSVMALSLGHAGVRSTDPYLHADLTIKERALALTTATKANTGRYRPADKTLAFLESLKPRRHPRTDASRAASHSRPPLRHSRGVAIARPMWISS